jgi:hypothetical protein
LHSTKSSSALSEDAANPFLTVSGDFLVDIGEALRFVSEIRTRVSKCTFTVDYLAWARNRRQAPIAKLL